MKFHVLFLFAIIAFTGIFTVAPAQVNNIQQSQIESVIGQITNTTVPAAATGISGDGRFVVFESAGNIATENPRNADGNREIFLFDYAQRRIFQITNTLSLRTSTTGTYASSNIRVSITNLRPVISNDGRWIAFGSNATTATLAVPNATNPGNFDAETFNPTGSSTTPNPLLADANTEIWLYQIPAAATVNLSAGDEIAATDLTAGTFTRVTNSLPSRVPVAGSSTLNPLIGDDNRDATIDDNGNYVAFTSNRDLVTNGNSGSNANNEIFTYARAANQINQITTTSNGTGLDSILNLTPTLSGDGRRVVFQSNADKPMPNVSESNTERNYEVFVADLNADGALPTTNIGVRKQITVTAPTSAGDPVNILDFGKRMSRDGRYIALDSYADLQGENTGTNYTTFALYLYDVQSAAFRRIGPRSDADATISGGEVPHFGGFTDYIDGTRVPQTLVLESRQNIVANGTVAAAAADGLNPDATRPPQIYAYPLVVNMMQVPAEVPTFKRLTKFPALTIAVVSIQPIPSNSVRRMTFNLGFTEIGTGNFDLSSEAYYYRLPVAAAQSNVRLSVFTGASRQIVSASAVPTPTPAATPTPSPTPTPTGSPTPTPTPTPQTPAAVQGVSPGMLVTIDYNTGINNPVTARTAVGDLARRFTLPIELSGVTLTVNGAAVGLKSVSSRQITFVVPPGLIGTLTGTSYPLVINNNGVVFRNSLTIVPTRPDIFTFSAAPGPNGRARIFNITNTVFTTEPFTVTTLRFRGGRRVPTVMRLFLTGVESVPLGNPNVPVVIRIRDVAIAPTTAAILREPGVYSLDFIVPPTLLGAGDVPIVVTITVGGTTFQTRLDDTAPRLRFL